MRDAKVDLEACEKATRGPWFVDDGEGDIFGIFADIDLGAICYFFEGQPGGLRYEDKENAEFIVLAREALPYWINRAVELEGELKRIRLGMGDDYGDDPIKVIQKLKAENKRLQDRLFLKSENAENWDEEGEHDD